MTARDAHVAPRENILFGVSPIRRSWWVPPVTSGLLGATGNAVHPVSNC
ncbi:hypothetical protein [Hymenobacter volaticus]|uniref:Uncharacterized protein n=1 Tax=Hymenobacter volaticus TaxID=2932254 RepID=A0ABY4GFN4_9BACT|nr:hypothetical protein [Hymenobacter volaticus]UOQ69760.1 hypothetical protein MUN86_30070 [Hymenobacter volaticus]